MEREGKRGKREEREGILERKRVGERDLGESEKERKGEKREKKERKERNRERKGEK